jgi:hypothetical protein
MGMNHSLRLPPVVPDVNVQNAGSSRSTAGGRSCSGAAGTAASQDSIRATSTIGSSVEQRPEQVVSWIAARHSRRK